MCEYKIAPTVDICIGDKHYLIHKKRKLAQSIIEFDQVGYDMYKMLKTGIALDDLAESIITDYGLNYDDVIDEIQNDVNEFIKDLKKTAILSTEKSEFCLDINENDHCVSDNGFLSQYEKIQKEFSKKNKPYKLFVDLTYNCNLRCLHCYVCENVNSICMNQLYLEKDRIFKLIDEMENMGVVEVIFTGGEPFLHPNIFEILEYATSKNLIVTLLTNANFLYDPEVVKKLIGLNLFDIRVSIYGLENNHDMMTNVKGSFNKSFTALKNIRDILGIGTAVYVVTNLNYDDHNEVLSLFTNEGINVSINSTLVPTSKGNLSPLDLRISPQKYNQLITQHNIPLSGTNCTAGISRFRICPNGDLNPCELIPNIKFGNIYEDSLENILNGTIRHNFIIGYKKMLDAHQCKSCHNRTICNFCPASFNLENGDYNIPSSYLCKITQQKECIIKEREA